MAKTEKQVGNFKATTVDLRWNGKDYRVHPDVAKSIKAKKDYSAELVEPKTIAKDKK